jgi:hypothetical protein
MYQLVLLLYKEHNRDHNAAVNIKTESKRLLVASQELNKKPVENYMGPGERLAVLALAA